VSLNDKHFKEILNDLDLSNNEKSWLRDCVRKHGSVEKAEAEIYQFLKYKLKHIEEDLEKTEEKKKEIRKEISILLEKYQDQVMSEAKKSYKLQISEYRQIKSNQRQSIEKIILHSEQFKRKLGAYRLKFRTETEEKNLADIRKKLV
jgi:hypothetical protein